MRLMLSSAELMTLFGIYDNLGLPVEVILQLITRCLQEYEERYGTGRKPTMRYIEKAAFIWEKNGIYTLEQSESYIR